MPWDLEYPQEDKTIWGYPRPAKNLLAFTVPRPRRRIALMLLLASLTLGLIASFHSRRAIAAPYPPEVDLLPDATELEHTDPLVQTTADSDFPLPNLGNIQVHDPNILSHNGELYLFKGAVGIQVYKAFNISGPWTSIGTVLDGPSVINKATINRQRPWAPTTIAYNNTFYCFYAVTKGGTRNSAVGVATSTTLEPHSWTDHGALFNTYDGNYADVHPFTVSNAIDPAPFIDPATGKGWIVYGSFWTNIWQLPLTEDLLTIENPSAPTANHLSYLQLEGKSNIPLDWYPLKSDPQGSRPEEGPFLSYHKPYYYLWYSHGKCCKFHPNRLPPAGTEYSIRVGRSENITGPFVDDTGKDLVNGGGQVVYGSNHDNAVYAPGGLGVLTLDDGTDILYYHYINKTIGFKDTQTQLGWHFLDYQNGWPVVSAVSTNSSSSEPSAAIRLSGGSTLRTLGFSLVAVWFIFFAV